MNLPSTRVDDDGSSELPLRASSALRAMHRLMAVLGIVLTLVLTIVLSRPIANGATPTRFASARACIDEPLMRQLGRAGFQELLGRPSPVPQSCRQTVALPYSSPRTQAKLVRRAVEPVQRARYVFQYVVPPAWQPGEALVIYSPRVAGLAWQVRVNGHIVGNNLDDWRMTWNRPLIARTLPEQLRPGEPLEIELAIAFEPARGHALSRVSIGPSSTLVRTLAIRRYLQEILPFASILTLSSMAVFFLCFWLLRRQERAHLLLTCSSVAWAIYNLQFVLPTYDAASHSDWYRGITSLSVPWIVWLLYLFVLQVDQRRSRVFAFAMPLYVLVMSLLMLPLFRLSADIAVFYHGLNWLVAAALTLRVWWLGIAGGSLDLRVIGIALLSVIIAGAHDTAMFARVVDAEGVFLLPYGSLLIFGSLLFAVQRRYVHAINQHERLSSSLAERLAAREAELMANQKRVLELERNAVLAGERQRLMRDMHDGLGSTLLASLAILEEGRANPAELKTVLRDSVDDLRAVIDSLEPVEGDLVSLLATLRFRLAHRLALAGIDLEWEMHELPPLEWLGPPQALQVMRVVQEALANVLKHASAHRIRISAKVDAPWIEVRISDDGCGFALRAEPNEHSRGLCNMRRRAASLGARLSIDSLREHGTTVRLLLPITVSEASLDVERRHAERPPSRRAVSRA